MIVKPGVSRAHDGAHPADPAHQQKIDNALELAIGRQVRAYRQSLGMTVADLARQAGLSTGMVSKIENAMTSASLPTLGALAAALNVPVTALFRKYEQARDVSFVRAGEGLQIERRGTRAGHQYQLLGHSVANRDGFDCYLITLSEQSDVFPLFQHQGVEFIYLLSGEVVYRHGSKTYPMVAGDSLYFDSDAPHGPEELIELPIRMLAVIAQPQGT